MYGLTGKITAVSGQREALIAILLEGTRDMPGCLSYIIACDTADEDAIWITEVWESQASHQASLSLPPVLSSGSRRGRERLSGCTSFLEFVWSVRPLSPTSPGWKAFLLTRLKIFCTP
jgi:quinol monooxygenase YgiN